jgi:CheY-like chemotaxis protein
MTQDAVLSGLRLLVVEDETMIALMLEDMLDTFGCVVVDVAGTLSKGLALVTNEDLDLDGAILDVNLGGEKVYPVAERLTARGVPFFFCTGYGLAGLAADFAHVPTLTKPYMREELEGMLVSVIAEPRAH